MANKIQIKRGSKANLPVLDVAEPAFTTDEKAVYIGDGSANIQLGKQSDIDDLKTSKTNGKNTIYTDANIASLGLTMPCTCAQIVMKMKVGDIVNIYDNNVSDVLPVLDGVLTIYKPSVSYASLELIGLGNDATSEGYKFITTYNWGSSPSVHKWNRVPLSNGWLQNGLNAEMLDGNHATDFVKVSELNANKVGATPMTSKMGMINAFSNQWVRIATSKVNIGKNTGLFRISFSDSWGDGTILLRATCKDGKSTATGITQLEYINAQAFGFTQARIVYNNNTDPTGNYAYLELYLVGTSMINYTINLIDGEGWTLMDGTGSIPTGYTSEVLVLKDGIATTENVTATKQLISNVATGTAPLSVVSTTVNAKLNADMVDGKHATDFAPNGYGLGGYAKAIANGVDLNTILTTGWYQGCAMLNAPTNGYYYITAVAYSATWVVQTASGFGGGTNNAPDDIYSRTLKNGVWGAWRRMAYSESVNLTFLNGWVNYGSFDIARATRVGNVVTLSGLIKSGTLGVACITLPAGYRPPASIIASVINNVNGAGRLDVQADGSVIPSTACGNGWISLNGISFYVNN